MLENKKEIETIDQLLEVLPEYSLEDFTNSVPFDLAAELCSSRDEIYGVLKIISDAAESAGVPTKEVNLLYGLCMNYYILLHEETPYMMTLPEDFPNVMEELERDGTEESNQDSALGDEKNCENQDNIIRLPRERSEDDHSDSTATFVVGGRQINLECSPYIVSEEGVGIFKTINGVTTFCKIFSHFVAPSAYVKGPNGEETVNISYYRDNEWHELKHVKKSKLYAADGYKILLDYGVDFLNPAFSNETRIYFWYLDWRNRNKNIPLIHSINKLGWIKNHSRFVPYGDLYEFSAEEDYRRTYDAVTSSRGTYRNWFDAIKMFRDTNHQVARIVLAASFASVLIRPLDGMRFAVDLIGKSGCGKSVALRMAAGVWGDPDRMIASFGSTAYGAMQRSNFLSDLPLILDESETRKNRKDFDEFVYSMCGDYDRIKANALKEPPVSQNCIFISGEHPIMTTNSNAGARNRVLDLRADSFIFFDEDEMQQYVPAQDANYGLAGPLFVKYLLEDKEFQHVKEVYQKHLKSFPKNRQARIPAIILTADELIDEWLFNDGVRLSVEDIAPYLREKEKEEEKYTDNSIIHNKILQQIRQEPNEETERGRLCNPKLGRGPAYAFKEGVLERLIWSAGGNVEAYIAWASENDKLVIGNENRHKNRLQVNFKDGKHWCYVINCD